MIKTDEYAPLVPQALDILAHYDDPRRIQRR